MSGPFKRPYELFLLISIPIKCVHVHGGPGEKNFDPHISIFRTPIPPYFNFFSDPLPTLINPQNRLSYGPKIVSKNFNNTAWFTGLQGCKWLYCSVHYTQAHS